MFNSPAPSAGIYGLNGGMGDDMARAQAHFIDRLISDHRLDAQDRSTLHQAAVVSKTVTSHVKKY